MNNQNFINTTLDIYGKEDDFNLLLSQNPELIQQVLDDRYGEGVYDVNNPAIKVHFKPTIDGSTPDITISCNDKTVTCIEAQKGRQNSLHADKLNRYPYYFECDTVAWIAEKTNPNQMDYIRNNPAFNHINVMFYVVDIIHHKPSNDTRCQLILVDIKWAKQSNNIVTPQLIENDTRPNYDTTYCLFKIQNYTKNVLNYFRCREEATDRTRLTSAGIKTILNEHTTPDDVKKFILNNAGKGGSQFANMYEDGDELSVPEFLFKGTLDECKEYQNKNNIKIKGISPIE